MAHLTLKDDPIIRLVTFQRDEGPAKYLLLADIALGESESETSEHLPDFFDSEEAA